MGSPDSLKSRFKRLFSGSQSSLVGIPLVSSGPSGEGTCGVVAGHHG